MMMSESFVFHHNLSILSDFENKSIEDILENSNDIDIETVGYPVLFKTDLDVEGLYFGYFLMDPDINLQTNLKRYRAFSFPKAEYLFTTHHGTLSGIQKAYRSIKKTLDERNISAVYHPILSFPLGLPIKINETTFIELWTATDSDYSGNKRLSDTMADALPRKRYNFYTW